MDGGRGHRARSHKGSDRARTGILGGQVHMMFDAITTMAAHGRAGKVKVLATSGKTRSAVTPEVPTVAEAGVPGYEAVIWLGVMAPAATPRPVLERLSAEIVKVVNAPEVKESWGKQGAVPMGMSPERFRYVPARGHPEVGEAGQGERNEGRLSGVRLAHRVRRRLRRRARRALSLWMAAAQREAAAGREAAEGRGRLVISATRKSEKM